MTTLRQPFEIMIVRQVFPSWAVCIPPEFEETYLEEGGGYWHAWDATRSISLSSLRLELRAGSHPPTAAQIVEALQGVVEGEPEEDVLPPGVLGVAASFETGPGSRAGCAISALLAVDGRALLATVTADDLDWARETLSTIRYTPERLDVPRSHDRDARAQRPRRRSGWDRRAN